MFNIFAPLFLKYPSWIHPEIFPGIPVLGNIRWYGLMYVLAFGTAYFVLRQVLREGALDQLPVDGKNGYKATEEDMGSFITWGIICLLIGARVFSTLVYDTTGTYWRKPWLIFWPFDPETKQFTGLAGMSYHGGFIGGFLGMTLWCIKHKRPVLRWIDAMAIAIPLDTHLVVLATFLTENYLEESLQCHGEWFSLMQKDSLQIRNGQLNFARNWELLLKARDL